MGWPEIPPPCDGRKGWIQAKAWRLAVANFNRILAVRSSPLVVLHGLLRGGGVRGGRFFGIFFWHRNWFCCHFVILLFKLQLFLFGPEVRIREQAGKGRIRPNILHWIALVQRFLDVLKSLLTAAEVLVGFGDILQNVPIIPA